MSISGKILDRMIEKARQAGVNRSDLFVADMEPINDTQCRLLIGYAEGLDTPATAAVEEFISNAFANKLVAQTSSLLQHDSDRAVSLVVSLQRPTRSLADASEMTRISTNMYIEPNTKNMWQVVDNGNLKFLARQTDENIGEIINARKSGRTSRKDAKFATLKTAMAPVNVGDHVKFLAANSVVLLGEVTHVSGERVSIKANGGSHTVDRGAIFGIIERSKGSVADDKKKMQDYFAKAFGSPELARKMTK